MKFDAGSLQVADTASEISITVDGTTVVADRVSAPTIYVDPDVDCAGDWTTCDGPEPNACAQYFELSAVRSGDGTPCDAAHGDERECAAGEGECPLPQTIDEWLASEQCASSTLCLKIW